MFGIYIYHHHGFIILNLNVHPRLETGRPSLSRSAKKVDRVNFTCPSVSSSSSSMSNVEMLEQGWLSESEEESSFEWGERKANGRGKGKEMEGEWNQRAMRNE